MPVRRSCDQDGKGEYYQYGETGARYYIREHGEEGARYKAYAQDTAIEHSDYTEKINRVQTGFSNQFGKYYRWGSLGTPYYVNIYGDRQARQRAYNDGALERLKGGYE